MPDVTVREPAASCRALGGDYIAGAGVVRRVSQAVPGVTVELPGAHWCEVREGSQSYGARFFWYGLTVALREAGRPPTPSEYAHSFFLVAFVAGPDEIPLDMLQDLDGLHAGLEADLRAGLGEKAQRGTGPGLLVFETGPNLRTVHAEVGAPPPGSTCIPTRIVHEARNNTFFPPGTVLRLTSVARYCLAPRDSASPAFVLLRGSERRLDRDPAADPRSAEWAALMERFFASLRFDAAPP